MPRSKPAQTSASAIGSAISIQPAKWFLLTNGPQGTSGPDGRLAAVQPDVRQYVLEEDHASRHQHAEALRQGPQLAGVTRPGQRRQQRQRRRGKRLGRLVAASTGVLQEVHRKKGDVLRPLAQGRQVDAHDTQRFHERGAQVPPFDRQRHPGQRTRQKADAVLRLRPADARLDPRLQLLRQLPQVLEVHGGAVRHGAVQHLVQFL
jgi:hypothetical protein